MVANAYFLGAHGKGTQLESPSPRLLVALWELDHRSALCKSGERDVCSLDNEPFLKGN